MTKRQTIAKIAKEIMKSGQPERLVIRMNRLAVKPGYAIEDSLGLAIGETYETLEEAHEMHSTAWRKVWEGVPA